MEGKTILIVDDDPDIVNAIRVGLGGKGATLEVAEDGNAAVEKVAQLDPDLIVLDAMRPKRSGFLVLEGLKSKKKRGDHPLVETF